MSKKVKKLQKHRRYSETFKRELVQEYERGTSSVLALSRRYQIAFQTIYRWIHQYSEYQSKGYILVEKQMSKEQELKGALSRIKELEHLVGQKQIELDYLHKLIDLAEADLGIQLKKK